MKDTFNTGLHFEAYEPISAIQDMTLDVTELVNLIPM